MRRRLSRHTPVGTQIGGSARVLPELSVTQGDASIPDARGRRRGGVVPAVPTAARPGQRHQGSWPAVWICLPGSGPHPGDGVTARRILLAGLARDAGIFGLVPELAPVHPGNSTFPGEVFLGLGAGALAGVRPAGPIRWPWRGCGSGSFPGAGSVAVRGTSSSLLSWPQRARFAGEPGLACWMWLPGGRLTTSGGTRCSQRLPTSAPPRPGGCARAPGRPGTGPARWPAARLVQPVLGRSGRALCSLTSATF
jgi:hypothetical protein